MPDADQVESDFKGLMESNPPVSKLLEACPYNAEQNIDGKLTEDMFMSKIFHRSDYTDNLRFQLRRALTNADLIHSRMLFINGFRRSGKTTFLRTFFKLNTDIPVSYLDFDRIGEIETKSPITFLLRGVLSNPDSMTNGPSWQNVAEVISALAASYKGKKPYFSKQFSRYIAQVMKLKAVSEDTIFEDSGLWKRKDVMTVFLLAMIRKNLESDLIRAIVFDNLDIVKLDFLSKTFQKAFVEALINVNNILQFSSIFDEPVAFTMNYKFIFCIRDANNAYLPTHINDHLGNVIYPIPFHFLQEGSFYLEVLGKRAALINEAVEKGYSTGLDKENAKSLRRIERLIDELREDGVFGEAIAPLYNYNMHKITMTLLELAGDKQFDKLLAKIDCGEMGKTDLGHRGNIMYWLLRGLLKNDFLNDFVFNVQAPKGVRGLSSYCLPSRMILTYIINVLDYDGSVEQYSNIDRRSISLWELVSEGFRFKSIYTIEDLLRTIAKMFLCHKANWTHLITLQNKKVTGEGAFDGEITAIEKYLKNLQLAGMDKAPKHSDRIRTRLEEIKIRVNPSGFAMVQHVLPQYEYYAAICGSDKIDRPLSYYGLEKVVVKDKDKGRGRSRERGRDRGVGEGQEQERFKFELAIDSVYEVVKQHYDWMQGFYTSVFKEQLGYDEMKYVYSPFAWKYFQGRRTFRGQFHLTRVCNYHIGYLDSFRLHVLKGVKNVETIVSVNRAIIAAIERYIVLLEGYAVSVHDRYIGAYKNKIALIERREYNDKHIKIERGGR